MKSKLTTWIFIGMIAGIVLGYVLNATLPSPESAKSVAGYISLLSDIFLRMIKMIVAPLVFSTLVVGIAKMGDSGSVGRVGLKAIVWFLAASLISLLLGILMVHILHPGEGLSLPVPDAHASTNIKTGALSLKEFVTHLVPKSFFEAMTNNEILQIVVFSAFFGLALSTFGERAKTVVEGIDQIAHVMLKVTGYVMNAAPIAVFAAMASVVTTQGLGVLATYGKFVGGFYLSLVVLWAVIAGAGFLFLGARVGSMIGLIREPFLLAFSTASSEAAYPKTL